MLRLQPIYVQCGACSRCGSQALARLARLRHPRTSHNWGLLIMAVMKRLALRPGAATGDRRLPSQPIRCCEPLPAFGAHIARASPPHGGERRHAPRATGLHGAACRCAPPPSDRNALRGGRQQTAARALRFDAASMTAGSTADGWQSGVAARTPWLEHHTGGLRQHRCRQRQVGIEAESTAGRRSLPAVPPRSSPSPPPRDSRVQVVSPASTCRWLSGLLTCARRRSRRPSSRCRGC